MSEIKNAMSLKGKVKNIAKEKHISAQLVLQNYMLERFLERISVSEYKDKFILKGGYLIASMIGIGERTTMDIDATLKSYPLSEESVMKMILDVCKINLNDNIDFEFISVGEIREDDEYGGFRVHIKANYPPLSVPLKLDITTGDKITPKEIEYEYRLMFENRSIKILSYNLETILAEKLEAVISRGDQTTRLRDYYDIHTLYRLKKEKINFEILKSALEATAKKRGSFEILTNYEKIINNCPQNENMQRLWKDYQSAYEYAKNLDLTIACNSVLELAGKIFI